MFLDRCSIKAMNETDFRAELRTIQTPTLILQGDIDKSVPYLSWLYQVNRGVLMAPGAEENWTLSVQHTEADVRRYVYNFREFARDITS